jgi:hypothetical protein
MKQTMATQSPNTPTDTQISQPSWDNAQAGIKQYSGLAEPSCPSVLLPAGALHRLCCDNVQ